MSGLLGRLADAARRSALLRGPVRRAVGRYFGMFELRGRAWRERSPFGPEADRSDYPGSVPFELGIVAEMWGQHWPYIAACRELRVPYRVLDLSGPDWVEAVRRAPCAAFLVRPSVQARVWKEMYDERLRIVAQDLGRIIFPSYPELWLWESKRRVAYWLEAAGLPRPRTWVFYSREEAERFARGCALPVVAKMDMGSGASGVRVLRSRAAAAASVARAFGRGIRSYRRARQEREWAFVIFQEFLAGVREWRTVRIGDSYFAYEKLAEEGGLHSGSGRWRYGLPPDRLLDFTERVTVAGGFTSMNVDVFETTDGELLVNELQPIFGQAGSRELCRSDGVTGRMRRDGAGAWAFEEGTFCRNFFCNLRVEWLLRVVGRAGAAHA